MNIEAMHVHPYWLRSNKKNNYIQPWRSLVTINKTIQIKNL